MFDILKKCIDLKQYNEFIKIKSIFINDNKTIMKCNIISKKILTNSEILKIKSSIKKTYLLKKILLTINYNIDLLYNIKIILKELCLCLKNKNIIISNNCYLSDEIIFININYIKGKINKEKLNTICDIIIARLKINKRIILILNNNYYFNHKSNSYSKINHLVKQNIFKIKIKIKIFKIKKIINDKNIIYQIYIFNIENQEIKIFTILNYNKNINNLKLMNQCYVIEYYKLYNIFHLYYIIKILSIEEYNNVKKINYKKHRIELHAHSNMSAMDGISCVKELICRAKEIGHTAIAITDHGVVQSFPEAANIARKYNMKIIFGTEGYIFDNNIPDLNNIVLNSKKYSFDLKFIILDISQDNKNNFFNLKFYKVIMDNLVFEEISINIYNENKFEHNQKIREFISDCVIISINAEEHERFLFEICNQHFTIINLFEFANFFINKKITCNLSEIYKFFFDDNIKNIINNIHKIYKIFKKCITLSKEKFDINNVYDINLLLISKEKLKKYKFYHIIIIAKNKIGIKNLYKLISESHINYFYKRPRIPKSLLIKYRNGLIIGSACEAGEIYSNIINNVDEKKLKNIAEFYDYLEIQPIINNKFLIKNNKVNNIQTLIEYNKKIFNIGTYLKKPVVATGDVHYVLEHEYIYRNILMFGMGYSDISEESYLYLKTTDDMIKEFNYLGATNAIDVVINNSNYIASLCEDNLSPLSSSLYTPTLPQSLLSLEILVNKNYKRIYGNNNDNNILQRLNQEMETILKHKFDVMYIISYELVKKSNQNGYLVGSRGSVGSSFVAYLLSITEVNPLPAHYICHQCKFVEFINNIDVGNDLPDKFCKNCNIKLNKDGYNIPFEVFLGFDGDKAPDIDLNFSGEYQLKAHKHVSKLFGNKNIFRAGTINTIAKKTAFGFVKKYLEETDYKCNKIEEEKLIKGCTGIKKTTGQHPGGIVILPNNKSIYDICPIQYPADASNANVITTHFDYNAIHNNLLKLDLLGHDDPTMLKYLQDVTKINVLGIPLDDKNTMKLFVETNILGYKNDKIIGDIGTLAIPEFGTKFVREMLKETKPQTFSELIKISGLSHGTDVWLSNAQELIKQKNITLKNVICVRDDIMNYLLTKKINKRIAFEIMESVRKGKGISEFWEKTMKEYNIPDWYINSCKKIKYIFPKAHAVAYVIMAFRIAWFKLYHPLEFYSAYFSIRAKNFDAALMTNGIDNIIKKINYFNSKHKMSTLEKETLTTLEICYEFYKRGFSFTKIDIYNSDLEKFLIYKDKFLIPPFTSITGLGKTAAQNIIIERKKMKFLSKENFMSRCSKISKKIITIFDEMDILETLPKSSQITLF